MPTIRSAMQACDRSHERGSGLDYILTIDGKQYVTNDPEQAQLIKEALGLIGEHVEIRMAAAA